MAGEVRANAPYYRDLVSELTGHSWIGVIYAVGSIVFLYLLGFNSKPNALFVAAEIPAACIVTAVLRHDPRLRIRVPLIWCLTAAFVWALPKSVPEMASFKWPNEIAALSLALLFGYWLVRAIRGSIVESKEGHRESSAAAIVANLASIWGATLIVVHLASLFITPYLIPIIEPTTVGRPLVQISAIARRISLWNWLPPGLLLFGLVFFAALRFKDDPYRPRNYQEVLTLNLPPVLNELVAALRLPVWLCVVVLGFVIHFVKQVWLSFVDFFDEWLGRTSLIFLALVVPTVLICLAHYTILKSAEAIAGYLSGEVAARTAKIVLLLTVHIYILAGMCLYLIAAVACALEIVRLPLRQVGKTVKGFIVHTGLPAGNAVGRSFSLYGILFLAVPIASILPGGPGIGLFSIVYGAILLLAAFIVVSLKVKSDATIKTLQLEVVSLRLFEWGGAADRRESKNYSTQFIHNAFRNICWELSLGYIPPTHRAALDIIAEWRRLTGEIVGRHICRGYIEPGSAACIRGDGLGADIRSHAWSPGKYNLKLLVSDSPIADTSFEIIQTSPSHPGAAVTPAQPWHQRNSSIVALLVVLVIATILEPIGTALLHAFSPHPTVWLRAVPFVWAGGVALIWGYWVALFLRFLDKAEKLAPFMSPRRRASDAAKMTIGFTFVISVVLLVVGATQLMGRRLSTTNTIDDELAGFKGTHWRGHVGRAPASLDILPGVSIGGLSATIHYVGVAEDLVVTKNPDSSVELRGIGSRREIGVGSFDLDTFHGHLSPDRTQMQGSLLDGAQRKGNWSLMRFTPTADLAGNTARVLSPSPNLTTRWQGKVGRWPAIMEIMPRRARGRWTAHVKYRNVQENLSVAVKEDGSVVLIGTGYRFLSGRGMFSLDTCYGQLSANGDRLQGLCINAAQSRAEWDVSRNTKL